jgi:zinc transporter ZupT
MQEILLSSLILFACSMAGGALALIWKWTNQNWLKLLLAFSAAYLLSLTVLHLLPVLYGFGIEQVGWFVIAGFLLQVILDFFSQGVEHGHAHVHGPITPAFLTMVMVSLWIHAFIEGMPFGAEHEVHGAAEAHGHSHEHSHEIDAHQHSLLLGIGLHKITEAFVLASLFLHANLKKLTSWILLVLFACIAPLGAFTHHWIDEMGWDIDGVWYAGMIGVLVGILLHVSTIILFEGEMGHKFNWMKFLMVLLGILSVGLLV